MNANQELSLFDAGYDRPGAEINTLVRAIVKTMPRQNKQLAETMIRAGHGYRRFEEDALRSGMSERLPYRA